MLTLVPDTAPVEQRSPKFMRVEQRERPFLVLELSLDHRCAFLVFPQQPEGSENVREVRFQQSGDPSSLSLMAFSRKSV